jgi:hypothetical protein
MQFLEVKYETPAGLPPPYCYYYHLIGRVVKGSLQVEFNWVYHHREDLTEEEITNEGFTGNDDYSWKGTLHEEWLRQWKKKLTGTKPATGPREEEPYLHITAEETGQVLFRGHPRNLSEWEYFLHEFIQAIYETAGKEAPLRLHFRRIVQGTGAAEAGIEVSFSYRSIKLLGKKQGNTPILTWEEMQRELQSIYALEYDAEAAVPKAPSHPGYYLDMGEGQWYELGKSARNPSPRNNVVAPVTRFIDRLLSPEPKGSGKV